VGEAIGERCQGGKLWYVLKYNQSMFLQFSSDVGVVHLMKENEDHVYMYVAGDGGPCIVSACELHGLCSAGGGVRLGDGVMMASAIGGLRSFVLGKSKFEQ